VKENFMNRIPLLAILGATAAVAGPYDQPYSLITSDTDPSADPHVIPVIVNRVDDENALDNRAIVAPGVHQVTVDVPPRKGFHTATQRTFQLETRPCARYYVAARLESPTLQKWQPIVRKVERLGDCEAKFHVSSGVK
jgi:hypothetical protein